MPSVRISSYWSLPISVFLLLLNSRPFVLFLLNQPGAMGLETLFYLFQHLRDICFVLLLFAGFYSLGRGILQFFKLNSERFNRMEKFLYSSLLGEAVAGYFLLVLGLSGLFQKWILVALFLLLSILSLRVVKEFPDLLSFLRNLITQKCSPASLLLVFCLTIALTRGVIASGAPPVNWDSLAYHLAFPNLFLEEEKIFRIPWSINAHYPLHTEMIYTLALALCSDLAAHWVNFMHGLLFLMAVFAVAKRFFSDFTARAAISVLAVQPVFQRVFGNAATDLPVAFICTMAFHSWMVSREGGDEKFSMRSLIRCGALCGIAASYKLTGLWISLSFFLLTTIILFRSGESQKWKRIVYFSFAVVIFAFPWYLKNWFWTGNPVWPYLGEWFGASPEELHSWLRLKASVTEGVEKNLFNWITIPLQLILSSKLFSYEPHYLAFPFLLLFAARLIQGAKKEAGELHILLLISIFISIWFWIYQDWRYFLPMTGLAAILISFWSEKLFLNNALLKIASIFLLIAFVPLKELAVNNEAFVFFGLKSKIAPELTARERYLVHILGDSYRLCRIANQLLPQNARVLFFGEVRGYYLNRSYVWGDPLNPGVFSYAKIKSTEELHKVLLEQKFSHIFYNPLIGNYKGDQSYYAGAQQLMMEFLRSHTKLIANSGPVALFQISTKSMVP